MQRLSRARWVSTFDHEPFIGAILRNLTILSALCILSAMMWRWRLTGRVEFNGVLEGTNVIVFLLADVRHGLSVAWGPRTLLHVGIALLFLIPYVRTLASLWYFAWVERNTRPALFSGCILAMLTYILFLW